MIGQNKLIRDDRSADRASLDEQIAHREPHFKRMLKKEDSQMTETSLL
jgi:hypothetical protein